MARNPTYSSKGVKIAWCGQSVIGLAPEDFIEISFNSSVTEEEVGADGRVQISYLPDDTGIVIIRLQQNSPSNTIFAAALATQEAAGDLIIGNISVNDPSGSLLATISNCHLKERPSYTLGSSANGSTREWTFFSDKLTVFSANVGNANLSQMITDGLTAGSLFKNYLSRNR